MTRLLIKKQIYMVVGYMLDKLVKELNEMNRLVQVYYENEQWALLDKTLNKINTWTTMISKQLENKEMEC